MPLENWLGDLPEMAPTPTQVAALAALGDMLDRLQPSELDAERSGVRWVVDESGNCRHMVRVTLEHKTRGDATVEAAIWSDQASVEWLGEDEHTDEWEAGPEEEWTTVVADIVGAILRGDYAVEDTHWLGRWIKTRALDVSDPVRPKRLFFSVNWPWWLLVRPPGAKVTRQSLDFGVQTM
jgi:hypothetical protein